MALHTIDPHTIRDNPFTLIGKDWMLVTSGNAEKCNTMTASWGGVGELWGKPVSFTFIRPTRYTYSFIEAEQTYSLCFFDDGHQKMLTRCGRVSGREVDKIKEAGLTVAFSDGVPYFAEARLVLICRVLYKDDIRPEAFVDPSLSEHYAAHDYHRTYVGEIVSALSTD